MRSFFNLQGRKRLKRGGGILGLSLALVACGGTQTTQTLPPQSSPTSSPQASVVSLPRFDGVTITIITRDAPPIAEPLQRRGLEFAKKTGAKIKIVTVPFGELYETIKKDLEQAEPKYSGIVFAPQWLVDFAQMGKLEDLTPRVRADLALKWEDVAPFFRDFSSTYQGQIYTIPLDGDFQMVYYRSDILAKAGVSPPETWDDYLSVAKKFHQQDLNGDGQLDYGSCISKKPKAQSYWMIWSIASAFLQTQGTKQGAFFDPDTMKPLVNNDAFGRVLEIYQETTRYGPPDELEHDLGKTRSLFITGRCALTLDWGDTGTLSIAPESKVVDKVGAVILPGSKQVLDRVTGKLVTCDQVICPYSLNGINHAPYAAFGGWSGAINKNLPEKVKGASYAFLSYIAQPAQANIDVTIGTSGFNPYRISQFTDRQTWIKAGMSFETASKYLGAISLSLRSPNVVLDLRIPQNNRYQEEVLDTVIAQFLAGKITKKEAMERIYNGWEKINQEVGKDRQAEAYRDSLGRN